MPRRKWIQHRPLFSSPVPADVRKPKIHWRIFPILWLGLKRTCMVLGAFVLISSVFGAVTTLMVSRPPAFSLPDKSVLFLEFDGNLGEEPQPIGFGGPFGFMRPSVHQLIHAIDTAKDDPHVQGIFARLEGGSLALAHIQEIRAALERFRGSGKFAYIYSLSYGDVSGFGGYYLAAAFDQIWMQPVGVVAVTGMNAEMPFFRGALDKAGIAPQFLQRKEYKTAYESVTHENMTPANRDMIQGLIDDLKTQIAGDIAVDRDMSVPRFNQLVDTGLFTDEEALKAGLVTKVGYADTLVRNIMEQVTGDPESEAPVFVTLEQYLSATGEKRMARGPRVALVYVVGVIMPSSVNAALPGMPGEGIAAADEIAAAIMEAAEDERFGAIVLRIDSPGGSPAASERILRAVRAAQEKGKPVIVSMGGTAASGGYWVAAYADMIFAMPATLTGSIGVVGGKVSAAELWKKLGVNWESVQWGDNAGLWSMNEPFSPRGRERIDAMLDQVYAAFTARVAEGRNMKPQAVEKIARGHVWSGQQAVKNGLVDEIGGLDSALDFTAQLLGQNTRRDVSVVVVPAPKTAFEELMDLLAAGGPGILESLKLQGAIAALVKPFATEAALVGAGGPALTYESLKLR
jgi:protease-4